ncbi:hypothetical protein C8R45DRAFT_1103465 [Mycena sanguinolenta]|nr:hypothetical protein C8R45DRAFT_1103465 [Mycena sanguinolenta]
MSGRQLRPHAPKAVQPDINTRPKQPPTPKKDRALAAPNKRKEKEVEDEERAPKRSKKSAIKAEETQQEQDAESSVTPANMGAVDGNHRDLNAGNTDGALVNAPSQDVDLTSPEIAKSVDERSQEVEKAQEIDAGDAQVVPTIEEKAQEVDPGDTQVVPPVVEENAQEVDPAGTQIVLPAVEENAQEVDPAGTQVVSAVGEEKAQEVDPQADRPAEDKAQDVAPADTQILPPVEEQTEEVDPSTLSWPPPVAGPSSAVLSRPSAASHITGLDTAMEVDDEESLPAFPDAGDPTAPLQTALDVDMAADSASDTGDEKSSSSTLLESSSSESSDDEESMAPVQNRPPSHAEVPVIDEHAVPPLPKLDFTKMQSGATPSTELHPPPPRSWARSDDAHIIDAADAAYAKNYAKPFHPVFSDAEAGSAGEESGGLEDSEDESQKTEKESSDGYNSSWSNSAREESRLRARNPSEFTTQEEDDEEDLMEFEEEAAADRKSHRRQRKITAEAEDGGVQSEGKAKSKVNAKAKAATRTWKGKAKQTTPHADDDAIQDGEDAQGESAAPHKSGPIPQAAQEALLKAYQKLEEVVKQTAIEINKPEQLLWKLIGTDPKQVRATSGWNMYQMWLAAPDGSNQQYPMGISAKQRSALDSLMWEEEKKKVGLQDDPDLKKVREKMPWLTQWYDEYSENRSEESTTRAVSTIVADLNKISTRAHRDLKVHAFGWVVNTAGKTVAFGTTDAYKMMHQKHASAWKQAGKEYQSKLHVMEMEIEGLHAGAIVETNRHRQLAKERPQFDEDGELLLVSRDGERKFIKDCLVTDFVNILVSRGEMTVVEATTNPPQMRWASGVDFAYENQLRLENWDNTMATEDKVPKPGFNVNVFQDRENARVLPAMDARHFPEEGNEAREKLARKSLRIVSWTEDEKARALHLFGDIPIVKDMEKTKTKMREQVKATEPKKKASNKTAVVKSKPRQLSDDDEEEPRRPKKKVRIATRQAEEAEEPGPPKKKVRIATRQAEESDEEAEEEPRAPRKKVRNATRQAEESEEEGEDAEKSDGVRISTPRPWLLQTSDDEEEAPARRTRHARDRSAAAESQDHRCTRHSASGSEKEERESRKRQVSRNKDQKGSEQKAGSSQYTKGEKRRLTDVYEQAKQETDELGPTGDSREMKFRLQVGPDRSPYIYGWLEKLKRGEKQNATERNTYYLDENIEWQYLPGGHRCVPRDSTNQDTYDSWARRLRLEK